ncbi:MAG: FixH family protein [Xanthobacteraceae bacterium]
MKTIAAKEKVRPITGFKVLLAFIAFFGVVGAVNGVLVRFATATFGGVDEKSPYQAGLQFNREIAAAAGQNALKWNVQAHFSDVASDRMQLTVVVHDSRDAPPSNVVLEARLAHPSDERHDHEIVMSERNPGNFSGEFVRDPGQWNLVIEAWRGDERLFRSVNRVGLH